MPADLNFIKEFIDHQLNFARDLTEYILGEVQNFRYTDIVTELVILQKKIQQAADRSLTVDETVRFQRKLLDMIMSWNPAVSNQLWNFHNYYVDIIKIVSATRKPLTLKDFNPFELMYKNRDKYMRADSAYVSSLKNIKTHSSMTLTFMLSSTVSLLLSNR